MEGGKGAGAGSGAGRSLLGEHGLGTGSARSAPGCPAVERGQGATASLPPPWGEPGIPLCRCKVCAHGGLALVGSLLPLGCADAASATQGASEPCQGHLLPTSPAHHASSLCTGSGRRVSGGLRRWSLGRGCSLAAPRTKPGGGRLRAPTTSLSRVPPHPPPKPSEPLVGRLPRPQPPRWPRQLLHSCSQTLRAS